mmetsp:Transcript_40104/g.55723  ORF Transcript_40104/g.55723 Transcript_40104/m.55723 type:complete len:259 (-) Transcript_40104:152-928(-)|eukprot:CAMPEP_0196585482 /NCGR_PEP_ID=MMETSP1081-20130531/50855_1 /TAXON_ID=36882 /ORGANISM="Pyramimonas amylifera, Strain CCMP720" /LENGTH=258 /DNA_ID=CAMNT_0041907039 /DNA_START=138 /DNA_END=914 /DNA_ORIENTATION=+
MVDLLSSRTTRKRKQSNSTESGLLVPLIQTSDTKSDIISVSKSKVAVSSCENFSNASTSEPEDNSSLQGYREMGVSEEVGASCGGKPDTAKRTKCVTLLGDALRDPTPLFDFACAIEAELLKRHGNLTGKQYMTHARSLVFNLKANAPLRQRVLQTETPPALLCSMSSEELATTEVQLRHTKLKEAAMRGSLLQGDEAKGISTDKFKCEDCSSTDCVYMTLVGARDIGKSETWGSKDKSAGGTRITCQQCGHHWIKDF